MTTSTAAPLAVHSVERIVFTIPEIETAENFYAAFGMNAKRNDSADHKVLDIYTHGHPHRWMSVIANGEAKKTQYLSFGIYEADKAAFADKISKLGLNCEPSHYASVEEKTNGIWLKTPEGTLLQLVVADKVSPNQKTQKTAPRGLARPPAAAQMRTQAKPVHPRNLSHVLMFSADVGSLDDVGEGSEQLRTAGYPDGWGVGRHVLGSNYFYYARDPWGSFAEYSYDIDFVPKGSNWVSGDYPPEDSFYLWGPAVPDWFTVNTETAKEA